MTYLTRTIPRSVREVVDVASYDRVSSTVKNAVANYIDNFLNTTGVLRSITQELGSHTLQYITDKKIPTNSKGEVDPTIRQVQLAKLTEEITQKVPAILISDSAIEWETAGLNQGEEKGYLENGSEIHRLTFIFKVTLTIAVITNDESSTKDLSTLLALMMGPLQNIAGGSRIVSEDAKSKWVVFFPLAFPAPTFEKVALEGDNIDQYWVSNFSIDLKYESKAALNIDIEKVKEIKAIVDKPDLRYLTPEICYTGKILVGQSVDIKTQYMQPDYRVSIDSASFTVTWERLSPASIRVTGNKPGKITVYVEDGSGKILTSKEFEVTFV